MRDFKVIMFTFESIYTRKVGGLAEVPSRLGKALMEEGVEVEIYTPNHGVVDSCREPVYRTGSRNEYCISLLENTLPRHYVVGGHVLDDPIVYSPRTLLDKSMVFARVVSEYLSKKLIDESRTVILHGHDWHSYPVLLSLNALLTQRGRTGLFVYHVHLLSKTKIPFEKYREELGICENTLVRGVDGVKPFSHYFDRSTGFVEKLAALTVDIVVTVSRGYAKSVERAMGSASWRRVDFIPNASPFTWDEVKDVLTKRASLENPEDLKTRLEYRKWLLTKGIENIQVSWSSSDVEKAVKRILEHYDVNYNKPFRTDGPLLFAIGRLTKQKGFDILVKALDALTLSIPRVRIIVAAAPLEWGVGAVNNLAEAVLVYDDNLRVLPGMISRENAIQLYYAANTTVIPSRAEPFGLVALESMASGTPVAASRVNGLVDLVLDVRFHGSEGTGVLFEPSNPQDLAYTSSYLVNIVENGYTGDITGLLIRKSCMRRAEEFNWARSALKAIEVYTKICKGCRP